MQVFPFDMEQTTLVDALPLLMHFAANFCGWWMSLHELNSKQCLDFSFHSQTCPESLLVRSHALRQESAESVITGFINCCCCCC
jgi:hypothetical protein